MATFKMNIKAKRLEANSDIYSFEEPLPTDTLLNVLSNDILGVTPTDITEVNIDGFILGDIDIELDNKLKFTPNGNFGTSSFTYTIEDNIGQESIGVVTITTIET